MSTRQSREELIKKGVLKEVYEKGERTKDQRIKGPCLTFRVSDPVDGALLAVPEDIKMGDGRSPVLSESEGSELMEGAAAAVGRRSLCSPHL